MKAARGGIVRACAAAAAVFALHAGSPARAEADASAYADCSAYFFMAANANPMGEFDGYYTSGEYAYNRAVQLVGERDALARFNVASGEINTLIDRDWTAFNLAEDRYGVICADIFREATNPDR